MNTQFPVNEKTLPQLRVGEVNAQPFRILNLQAGLGGNRAKWKGNIKVTAVEIEPKIAAVYKANFPDDEVIIGDAMEYLKKHRNEFDFIWSSPPCQKHSKMMKATRHDVADFIDLQLYQVIIFLMHFFKGKYCVENVNPYYEPLIKPTKILGRHFIWANFEIDDFEMPNFPNFIKGESPEEIQAFKDWLGIHYEGNIYYKKNHSPGQILRNCVPPDFGLHILNAAMSVKQSKQQHSVNEPTLF
jgi:DNA (cytosine-5)-methyltransferase 1